jgi:hypothetical protein
MKRKVWKLNLSLLVVFALVVIMSTSSFASLPGYPPKTINNYFGAYQLTTIYYMYGVETDRQITYYDRDGHSLDSMPYQYDYCETIWPTGGMTYSYSGRLSLSKTSASYLADVHTDSNGAVYTYRENYYYSGIADSYRGE